MDATALTSSASKLLDALERLGVSQGADLRSAGPSGTPPKELVETFERALERTDADPASMDPGPASSRPDLERPQDGTPRIDAVHGTEAASPDRRVGRTDPAETDRLREIDRLTAELTSGTIRPDELLRLQYLAGVLKVHTTAGQQTSQSMGQGMENILRNSQ